MEQKSTFKKEFTEVRVLIIIDQKKLLKDKYCEDAKISHIADKLDTTRNAQKLLIGSTKTRPPHKHDKFGNKFKDKELLKEKKEVHFVSSKIKGNIQDRPLNRQDPTKKIGGSYMKRYCNDAKISVVLDKINCTDITMSVDKTLDTNNNYHSIKYGCDEKLLNCSDNSFGIQKIHEPEINQKTRDSESQFRKNGVFSEFLKDNSKYGREGLNEDEHYCKEARLSVCCDKIKHNKCVKSGHKNISCDEVKSPENLKAQQMLLTDDMLAKMKKLFKNVTITPKRQRKDEKQEFDIRKVKTEPKDDYRIEAKSSSSVCTSFEMIKQEPMIDIKCEPSDNYDTVDIKCEPSNNYDTVDIKCEPSDNYDTVDIKCELSNNYDTVDIKCESSDNYDIIDIKCEPSDFYETVNIKCEKEDLQYQAYNHSMVSSYQKQENSIDLNEESKISQNTKAIGSDIVETVSRKTDICEKRTTQTLTTGKSGYPTYRVFKVSPEVYRIEPVVNDRKILESNVNSEKFVNLVQAATDVSDNSTKLMESMHQHATKHAESKNQYTANHTESKNLKTANCTESINLHTANRTESTNLYTDNRIEDMEFELDCDNDYIVIDEWSSDET
ncbi:unnamed protein product [Mytilus coruscus]|uniref:Uncharacterized protein n=1 Tax=Mytilus coruscus TaxID=42192 RepID=A0A6J8E586_MYTCO|nr:unnamed protein product [Mytilus coruscus]